MFRLHGFFTQNSLKAVYVLEAIGTGFDYQFVNLAEGQQKTPEFLAMNPVGKVPVLEHDGKYLFESGAICRYVGNVTGSDLYPTDPYERGVVDQWIDYFTCHPGRWLTTLYFQNVIKPRFGLGDPDADAIEEATKFAGQQLKVVDEALAGSEWLANGRESIADYFAFAYVEQEKHIDFSIDDFPNLKAWYEKLDASDVIARARARLPK